MSCYNCTNCKCSGLPQDLLRSLADKFEAIEPELSVHDVRLARLLAEKIDAPRRDMPLDTATIETALNLIEDMKIHILMSERGG